MNIAVLCGETVSDFKSKVLETLFRAEDHRICVCVIDSRPPKTVLRKLYDNLNKGRGGYVFIMALRSLFGSREPGVKSEAIMRKRGVPVVLSDLMYSKETVEQIGSFKPDVMILIGGFGIIKEPLLNATKYGVISYHHGNMREYRGQPPAFWELYHGEREMGVTVQRLSRGLDCGEAIVEKTIQIRYSDTLNSLKKRAYNESIEMMYKAINVLEKDGFTPEKITTFGRVYTIPNFRQWLIFNLKIGYRKVRYKIGGKKGND